MKTILIADDQKLARQALQGTLARGDYKVLQADTGHAVVELMAAHKPDLLVLDINMPGPSGLDLCRQIKRDPATQFVPIIIVTAADDIRSRIRAFEMGADDLLPKPVIAEELLARVGALLRLSSLIKNQIALERSRAELEKKLELTRLREEQQAIRTRFYRDVLFAATGGRLVVLDAVEMNQELEGWSDFQSLTLSDGASVGAARRLTEQVALQGGLPEEAIHDLVLSVSEAATNALKHGNQGLLRVGLQEEEVWVLVEDDGPGLRPELLPQATLQKGFSTAISMGMGFPLMLELLDHVKIASNDEGTRVLLCKTVRTKEDELDALLERFAITAD